MDEKIQIKISGIKNENVDFNGQEIKIDERITLEKYEAIVRDIFETILNNDEVEYKYGIMNARYARDVVDLCTNIDISKLEPENFNSLELINLLTDNIENYYDCLEYIGKEYDRWVMEKSFGIVAKKVPTAKEIEKSVNKISKMIKDVPEDKLEMIAKGIVWDKMPSLGAELAPASKEEDNAK